MACDTEEERDAPCWAGPLLAGLDRALPFAYQVPRANHVSHIVWREESVRPVKDFQMEESWRNSQGGGFYFSPTVTPIFSLVGTT